MEITGHKKSSGHVEIDGLHYSLDELDVELKASSKIWEFGRVDQVDIQGDHLIRLLRDTHTLVFFSLGENKYGQAKIDGKRVMHGGRLHGKIDILPKGSEFSAAYVGGHFSATVMSIDSKLATLLPSAGDTLDLKPQTQLNDNFLRMMCEQFIHASDPLLQESLLMTLLVYMSRKSFEPQVSTGFNLGKKRKLIDYVEEHLENYISVSDLANEVGLSVFHFLRLFKTTFSITPYQYILQRRTTRAKILLTLTNESIEIISFKCGFNGGSQFSQTFSRIVGVTPSAFRKSLL
jgi:AraC family transcriptional regulator